MQVHPGDASRSRRRQSEVAVFVHVRLVGAHGFADPGQDRGQSNMLHYGTFLAKLHKVLVYRKYAERVDVRLLGIHAFFVIFSAVFL